MDLNPILSGLGGTNVGRTETRANPAADAAEGFVRMMREAEMQSMQGVTGGADPYALVTALAESKLAVDTLVTIRDRAVEAYQEVLRMPV